MGKQNGYRNGRRSADGMFQPDIKRDVNEMLDIYCRVNNYNKTQVVNEVLKDFLLGKFSVLKE